MPTVLTLLLATLFVQGEPLEEAAPPPPPPSHVTVKGTVRYVGRELLRKKSLTNTVDTEACGQRVKNLSVLVGRGKELANVVVELRRPDGSLLIPPGTPTDGEPIVTRLQGCQLAPRVVVLPVGSSLEVVNADRLLHVLELHALKNEPTWARLPRYRRRLILGSRRFEREEKVKVSCEVHSFMRAWLVITDNPYVTVTGREGEFAFHDVPAGEVVLTAWHEEAGSLVETIVTDEEPAVTRHLEFR